MATKYKSGDEVEVKERLLPGRYTLVSRHRFSWEAKHHKTGRTVTIYEDEFVLAPAPRAASRGKRACADCGAPATCFGRSGLKCDRCCHDWCYPMPEPTTSKGDD
jgi:hypothetical protein